MSLLERVVWIHHQIRQGHYPNADSVAHEFGVSRRTAYADRDYLITRLNAPLERDVRRNGWYYTDLTYTLPSYLITLTQTETLRRSLMTGREYLASSDAVQAAELAAILAETLPQLAETRSESVSGAIPLAAGVSASAELLDVCRRGVQDHRRLRLLYYSAHRNEVTERVVRPYHLLHWRGEPYLIAWCEWRQNYRDFFLGRIREWKLLSADPPFLRDPSFNENSYLQAGFYLRHGEDLVTVRVLFSPYQARWIRERSYHPSQQIQEQEDGGLEMTLQVAGTSEIKRWLLGYGAEVEVLEPEVLRLELADEAKKLSEIYAKP